jgi:Transposase DDE domain
MFFRVKPSGPRHYLQLVENFWDQGQSRQRVLATLGRLEELQESGQLDALLASGARLAQHSLVVTAYAQGQLAVSDTQHIGAPLVFERLWQSTGCRAVVEQLLGRRRYEFNVERAVFLTVLHRLLAQGSDRAGERWKVDYEIDGAQELELHQMYRAMAWLGDVLPQDEQSSTAGTLGPRCTKDLIEEGLFARRRDLFTDLDIVFFDTTSLYFEGHGGATLGQHGHSKDHRPDERQMIVGAVLEGSGRPVCCEMWPGNMTDVRTLVPVVQRLRRRFRIRHVCIVADRGMISRHTLEDLEDLAAGDWSYILGARMRQQDEVRERVLADRKRFRVVHGPREKSTDPAPLKVKEVWIEERRYVVCVNPEEVDSDRERREAIVDQLREQLHRGDKSLVGNKGYRRYLKLEGQGHFVVDQAKLEEEARYDGTWVLRTNSELPTSEVALQYKRLWMVEQWFRSCKSLLETRPIYHKCDETIRGHVFCSFLALVLRYELQARLRERGHPYEWADVLRDLERVQYVTVAHSGKRFRLRTQLQRIAGHAFQAAGVAVPPTVQELA